jgi:hypothetical protein
MEWCDGTYRKRFGIGFGMLEIVFRYLSGGNEEDHETLWKADHPAEIRPRSVCGFAVD